jgi:hypothetical protein
VAAGSTSKVVRQLNVCIKTQYLLQDDAMKPIVTLTLMVSNILAYNENLRPNYPKDENNK